MTVDFLTNLRLLRYVNCAPPIMIVALSENAAQTHYSHVCTATLEINDVRAVVILQA